MSTPLITIAMPSYNAAATVDLTMRSLLNQTVSDWELIVIDDGSTDGTAEVITKFRDKRIRFIRFDQCLGLSARLNQTIDLCRGKYYARMDADDIAYPQRLEKQLAYAEQHPDVDLFGTWMIVFGQAGHVRGKRMGTITPDFRYSTWTSIPIAHPTFFGHTKWFQENRYTTVYRYSQDQHLLLRTFRHSHFAVLPEILLGYREEKLTCVKQVRSRLSYFRCASQLVGELGYAGTAATLGAQAGKLGLDLLTILTHQDHRVLRSRAHAVTQQEQEEWVQVWQTLINSPQNLPAN